MNSIQFNSTLWIQIPVQNSKLSSFKQMNYLMQSTQLTKLTIWMK